MRDEIQNFENGIVNLINNCGLPVSVIRLVMEKYTQRVIQIENAEGRTTSVAEKEE